MKKRQIKELQAEEAEYFNSIARIRSDDTQIFMEVDIRRATKSRIRHIIDPGITNILQGRTRDQLINLLAPKSGLRILEVGCGSGWLSLELARRGCTVDAYDISPEAIKLAKRYLKYNMNTLGFGKINYHLADVSEVAFMPEKYDGVVGWSALHHLPDVPKFMDKVFVILKSGGIVASMDDMPRGKVEVALEYLFEFLLPHYKLSYIQKVKFVLNVIMGKSRLRVEYFSPMEQAKHSSVDEIKDAFSSKFQIIMETQENAFIGLPVMRMAGPDHIRYFIAKLLFNFDKLLCKIKLVKGFERILVAKKL